MVNPPVPLGASGPRRGPTPPDEVRVRHEDMAEEQLSRVLPAVPDLVELTSAGEPRHSGLWAGSDL